MWCTWDFDRLDDITLIFQSIFLYTESLFSVFYQRPKMSSRIWTFINHIKCIDCFRMFRPILRDQSCLLLLLVLIPEKFLESPILPREIDLELEAHRLVPKHKKTRVSKFSAKQNGRIKKTPRIKPPFCAPGFGTRKSVLADILKGLIKTQ